MAAQNTLSILTPSVNNLAARVFVRAAGLDFQELDVWGRKDEPEFVRKDPAKPTIADIRWPSRSSSCARSTTTSRPGRRSSWAPWRRRSATPTRGRRRTCADSSTP